MELILSVTEANVCPGAITIGVPDPATGSIRSVRGGVLCAILCAQFRIHVPNGRQIRGPRPRVQIRQECVVPLLGCQPRDTAVRIVEIPEDDGVARAGLLTGGLDLSVRNAAPGSLRFDL